MFRRLLKPLLAVLFVLGILLALPSTRRAVAANFYAITEWAIRYNRVNPASLPPQCSLGNDCTYVSSVDGKAYHRNAAGGDVIMEGAGGSGIGNWLFSGNNMDIASSGTVTMGGTNVTQWLWNTSGALRMTLTASALYSNNGITLGDGGAYWPNAFLNRMQFQAASSQTAAILAARDSSGNAHFGVDSSGFPSLGSRYEYRENWDWGNGVSLIASQTGVVVANSSNRWQYTSTVNATGFLNTSGIASGSPINTGVTIGTGTANGNSMSFRQVLPFVQPANLGNLYVEVEWPMVISAAGANNATFMAGASNVALGAAHPGGWYFSKTSAQTNWQCVTDDGATLSSSDSGVAATTSVSIFRVEYYGAGTVLGAKTVKYYIDGALVCNRFANVYSANLVFFNAFANATNTITQQSESVGPLMVMYNQVASALVP